MFIWIFFNTYSVNLRLGRCYLNYNQKNIAKLIKPQVRGFCFRVSNSNRFYLI